MKTVKSTRPGMLPAKILGGLALALTIGTSQAAVNINFDDSTNGSVFNGSTPLTNQYSGLGVNFTSIGNSGSQSGSGGAAVLDDANPANVSQAFGFNAKSGDDFLAFNTNLGTGAQIQMTFAQAVTNVSIWALANPNVQYTPLNTGLKNLFKMTAYDSSNNVVGFSQAQTGPKSSSATQTPWTNWQELSVSGQNIFRVVLDANANNLTYSYGVTGGYDNLSFTQAVPEPETYAMLLAGLGLLGCMARRRRNGQD